MLFYKYPNKLYVMNRILLFFFFLFVLHQSSFSQEYSIHEGVLQESPYMFLVPENADDNKIFFDVHGWRPPDSPHEAKLDAEEPFIKQLLDDGWIVAKTAFRENGVNHKAHAADIKNLTDLISETTGPAALTILEGESTAGTLMLYIAENHPNLADGVIAKSAFINLDSASEENILDATPSIPVLLMSNITEAEGPLTYVKASSQVYDSISMHIINRPGHVNINYLERYSALQKILAQIEGEPVYPISDGTIAVPPRASTSVFMPDSNRLENRIFSVDPYFGNLIVDVQPDDLLQLNIQKGDHFLLHIHNRYRTVFFGDTYSDVSEGEWVAFTTAENRLLIARNHEHAANTIHATAGDSIAIVTLY